MAADDNTGGASNKTGIVFFVNNQEVHTKKHELTGAAIKELAGIPADYELFEIKGDQSIPVGNEQHVHLENQMHFRAIPSGTFGRLWRYCLG